MVIEDKLSHLREYGIEHFGYRQFKKDGTSTGFCTYDYWEDIEDKKSFLESMSAHYKNELAVLKDKDSEFVVRTGNPDESSYFLKIMHKKNLWNSLVLYKKVDDMIEGYYFITSSSCNYSVLNHFINKRDLFSSVSNIMSINLRRIIAKPQYRPLNIKIFDPEIFQIGLLSSEVQFNLEERDIYTTYFTNRERETMLLLSNGYTTKNVAYKCGISPRTVEKYIASVKDKLRLNSKSQIIDFVRQSNKASL